MILYILEVLTLLIFWKFADFKRLSEMIPIMLTAVFLRFLDHYIIIDWFKLWTISGNPVWTPLSANLTIWVISAYFFIQYLPNRYRLIYGLAWVSMMFGYLYFLKWIHAFTVGDKWHMSYSFLLLNVNHLLIYSIWSWLYPKKQIQMKET